MEHRFEESRPAWIETDLTRIRENLRIIKKHAVGDPLIMPVIKANAYGHGALQTAYACLEEGADRFAVAILDEALELRAGAVTVPIMVLGWTEPQDYERAVRERVILTIYSLEEAGALSETAVRTGIPAKVHIKLDTGMNRIGFRPTEENLAKIKEIFELPLIEVEGVYTHLSKADEKDKTYSEKQISIFREYTGRIEKTAGRKIPLRHVANSATIFTLPDAHFDIVRPGIVLYGLNPSPEVDVRPYGLKPALSLKAKITRVERVPAGTMLSYGGTYVTDRDTCIASLPLGYADGYTRLFSNKAEIIYNGKRYGIAGRVCMDQCMFDLGESSDARVGDTVTLLGEDGNETITADELAEKIGTINYEMVCMFSGRLPRKYVGRNYRY